jgi:hypothetical protein
MVESDDGGRDLLICRAMNWRSVRDEPPVEQKDLAARILNGLAEPGVHRALIDLKTWRLLKWLDDPCPFFDWHGNEKGEPVVHPDDAHEMAYVATKSGAGSASGVVRLRAHGGGWTPIHVTAHRVELEENTVAGLLSLRLPTDDELASVATGETKPRQARRKTRARKTK